MKNLIKTILLKQIEKDKFKILTNDYINKIYEKNFNNENVIKKSFEKEKNYSYRIDINLKFNSIDIYIFNSKFSLNMDYLIYKISIINYDFCNDFLNMLIVNQNLEKNFTYHININSNIAFVQK